MDFPCDPARLGGELAPQVADPIGAAIQSATEAAGLSVEPWRLIAIALLAYSGTAAVKQALHSAPVNERHRALDWLARAGTLAWGALGGWFLLGALPWMERVGLGAAAGACALPVYMVVRRLRGSWSLVRNTLT